MSELNKQLQAIFISKVVLANVKEIMIPHFWWKKDRIQEQRRAELDEMAKQERLDEYAALGEEPPEEEEVVSRDISPAERELELELGLVLEPELVMAVVLMLVMEQLPVE